MMAYEHDEMHEWYVHIRCMDAAFYTPLYLTSNLIQCVYSSHLHGKWHAFVCIWKPEISGDDRATMKKGHHLL